MAERKAIILCVDDEDTPLTLRKLVLERMGYEVLTANSGEEALRVLAEVRVDLVISDHLMPGMLGAELARRVKTLRPNLPFILLSGVNEIPEDAKYADLFISKVEGPASMCSKIAAVLAQEATMN
ncbi:MAG TPA: response regulator [Terriglobales bacterium]|nr:response regulator [Terriglobales bacterium]